MKTAIIILPSLGLNTAPEGYLSVCAGKVQSKGYTLIHSQRWENYKQIDLVEFVQRMNPCTDALFMFVDYGVSAFMAELITRYYKSGIFSKTIEIETCGGNNLSLTGILKIVSDQTKVPIEAMQGRCRLREIVKARQFYCKYAKDHTSNSLDRIGKLINRDHATTIYSIKSVNEVRELTIEYCALFNFPAPVKKIDPVKVEVMATMPHAPEEKFESSFSHVPARSYLYDKYVPHQI